MLAWSEEDTDKSKAQDTTYWESEDGGHKPNGCGARAKGTT